MPLNSENKTLTLKSLHCFVTVSGRNNTKNFRKQQNLEFHTTHQMGHFGPSNRIVLGPSTPQPHRRDASPANPFSRLPAHWCESTFISSFSLKHTLERAGVRALQESIFKRPADNAPLAPFLLTRCAAVPAFFPSPSRERYHLVGKKGWGEPQGHGYGNDYRLRGFPAAYAPAPSSCPRGN